MLERRPPRRDPRVLALRVDRDGIAYAALDAWEVRGLGRLDHRDEAFALALRRLLIVTKPTAIVCAKPRSFWGIRAAVRAIATVAAHSGIPLVSLAGEVLRDLATDIPSDDALVAQYPELRGLDTSASADALKLALASFTKIPLPPRRYASTTLSPDTSSDLDAGSAARARSTPIRHRTSARRRARRRRERRRRRSQDSRR